MKVAVGKKIAEMGDPHKRLEAYIAIMEKISGAYETESQASYLKVKGERDGIPEGRDFLNQPLLEVKRYLQYVHITGLEYTIPATFQTRNRLWRTEGEGPLIGFTRFDVGLEADALDTEEVRKLKECVEALSDDYYIEFDGKRFSGTA